MEMRRRFWVESVLASCSGLLFLLTLVWRDWIEEVTGWDPDRHSGALESAIVAALLAVTLAFAAAARAEWRARAATP
jgi:DMSO/TMAO reductase YedYZ heme-binding membrane subunit